MLDDKYINIYNAIQNLYSMDFNTWQEVLAMLYNLVADTSQKFEIFEQKFNIALGDEVTKSIGQLYKNGELENIIKSEVFKNLSNKMDNLENNVLEQLSLKAKDVDLQTLKARVNTFTSLPQNSTTGDAELFDGRISGDGKKFSNIGEAIRTQFIEHLTAINSISDIIGGVASLHFVRGTLYQGKVLTSESFEKIVMTHYIQLDYDVTFSIKNGYSLAIQRIAETGTSVDEMGNKTTTPIFGGVSITVPANTRFRLAINKNGAVYNQHCDINELKFALNMTNNNLKNLIDTRLYFFNKVQQDHSIFNKSLSEYKNEKITVEKISFSNSNKFPAKAGILITFKLWSNDMCYQIFMAYDNTGLWYRKYNSNGIPIDFDKIITSKDIKFYEKPTINSHRERVPMVSFVDDDGQEICYIKYKSILDEYKIPFCFAVVPNKVGGQVPNIGKHMTLEQMKELQNVYGCEILSHTHNHTVLTRATTNTIYSELKDSINWLRLNGFNTRGLVYPQGENNKYVREVASYFYDYGIKVEDKTQKVRVNEHCIPSYYINRCNLGAYFDKETNGITGTNTLEYYKKCVDECIEKKGWLVFELHGWHSDFTDTQLQHLKDTIAYIKSKGVQIVTCSKAFEWFGNAFQSGDYLGYWNTEGYAISKNGEVDVPPTKVPNDIASWNIDKFPRNQTTSYRILYDNSEGFPEKAGIFEVHRQREDLFCFQMFYCALSDNIYRRRINEDGTPKQWIKINA